MSYCLTSIGKRGKSVSNVSEFGRKYFCFPMFPDMGDRETFEQTLKIMNISATMFLTLAKALV
jgi:hypothetical protein